MSLPRYNIPLDSSNFGDHGGSPIEVHALNCERLFRCNKGPEGFVFVFVYISSEFFQEVYSSPSCNLEP